MKLKYIFINTHGSEPIRRAIEAAIAAIFPDFSSSVTPSPDYPYICTSLPPGKYTAFHRQHSSHFMGIEPNDVTHFDAKTEFTRLIKFLDDSKAPPITIEDVAKESGGTFRDGTISADKKTITVGCSTVSREKVKEIYEAMFN